MLLLQEKLQIIQDKERKDRRKKIDRRDKKDIIVERERKDTRINLFNPLSQIVS